MITVPWWGLLIAGGTGWLFAISSAALGGYMVFRTKREAEPFFGKQQPGFAMNLDDGLDIDDSAVDERPEASEEASSRVISQLFKNKETG